MDPLRNKPTSEQLRTAGGPPPETDIITALGKSLPIEVSDERIEQIKQISKAVLSKLPGLTAGVVTTIVPMVLNEVKATESKASLGNSLGNIVTLFALILSSAALNHVFFNALDSTGWNPTKTKAYKNWMIGNTLGYATVIIQQILVGSSIKNLSVLAFASVLSIGRGIENLDHLKLPVPEQTTKITENMRKIINESIEKGLLKEDDVTTFMALSAMQNLIIFKSIDQLTVADFSMNFSKLLNDDPTKGLILNQKTIEKIKDRLSALSQNDITILETKLILEESEYVPENPEEIQKLFKIITEIAHGVFRNYQNEMAQIISTPEGKKFFDKFIDFLAEEK